MIAALVVISSACVALSGALALLIVRHASITMRALEASDARGRADAALAAKDADLRASQATAVAALRDLEKQKDVTRALQSLSVQLRSSAVDIPGADAVDVMLALAEAESADAATGDPAVRAGDTAGDSGGGDRLPRGSRPAPISDDIAGIAPLP